MTLVTGLTGSAAALYTANELLTKNGQDDLITELVDTRNDPRLSRIFANKVIKIYPAFREFYGMEDAIEQVVSPFFAICRSTIPLRSKIHSWDVSMPIAAKS